MTEVATVPAGSVPAIVTQNPVARLQELTATGMSPAIAIMFDEQLFNQASRIAKCLAGARGFVPKHCENNTEVCMAIVTRSLVWQLDPFAVAQSTYQPVPGAKVAYEAKLVQAILEQSGRINGRFEREYYGDWPKIQGKFKIVESSKSREDGETGEQKKKKYAVANWDEADEEGVGIRITAKLKGQDEPRKIELDLRQCHPRNSTLWATDPKTQIYYRAIRMMGNVEFPSLLMGVPFVGDEEEPAPMREINPERRSAPRTAAPVVEDMIQVVDEDGQAWEIEPRAVEGWIKERVREAPDDALADMLKANTDEDVYFAIQQEIAARQEKAKSRQESQPQQDQPRNGNGAPASFVLVDSRGNTVASGTATLVLDAIDKRWKANGGRRTLTHEGNAKMLRAMIDGMPAGPFRTTAEDFLADIEEDLIAAKEEQRGSRQRGML